MEINKIGLRLFQFLLLPLLFSCGDSILTIETVHVIQNGSKHKIWLEHNPRQNEEGSIVIPAGNSFESVYYDERSGSGGSRNPPFFGSGLLKVVYDDSISILHTGSFNLTIKRSILRPENWVGGEIGEGKYKYTYTFTDEDYQEAVDSL